MKVELDSVVKIQLLVGLQKGKCFYTKDFYLLLAEGSEGVSLSADSRVALSVPVFADAWPLTGGPNFVEGQLFAGDRSFFAADWLFAEERLFAEGGRGSHIRSILGRLWCKIGLREFLMHFGLLLLTSFEMKLLH